MEEGEWKKSRSHKKRPADAPPGPGKAWRRGLKKCVPSHLTVGAGAYVQGNADPVEGWHDFHGRAWWSSNCAQWRQW